MGISIVPRTNTLASDGAIVVSSTSLEVPTPTAVDHAVKVVAWDATTGQYAVATPSGTQEQGDTGWRRLVEYDSSGALVSGTAFPSEFTPGTGGTQFIDIRRKGDFIFLRMSRYFTATSTISPGDTVLWTITLPSGFDSGYRGALSYDNGGGSKLIGIQVATARIIFSFDQTVGSGVVIFGNPSGGDSQYGPMSINKSWPTSLPGTAA